MRNIFISAVLIFGFVSSSFAEERPSCSAGISSIENEFFLDLENGEVNKAWEFAFKDFASALGSNGLAQAVNQTEAFIRSGGIVKKWSRLKTVMIEESFCRQVYYVELEKAPIFFSILYYAQNSQWHITNIDVDSYQAAKAKGYFTDN